jgi:hypothetical protein
LDEGLAEDKIDAYLFFQIDEQQRESFDSYKAVGFQHPPQHCHAIILAKIALN